jgi:hypothetical protein
MKPAASERDCCIRAWYEQQNIEFRSKILFIRHRQGAVSIPCDERQRFAPFWIKFSILSPATLYHQRVLLQGTNNADAVFPPSSGFGPFSTLLREQMLSQTSPFLALRIVSTEYSLIFVPLSLKVMGEKRL